MREKNLTQVEVATACGMTQAAISKYLQGRIPKVDELFRMAQFFDTTAERLLGIEKPGIREQFATTGGELGEWRRRALTAEAALPKDGEPAKPYLPPVESMTLEAQAVEASTIWRMFDGLTPEAKLAAFKRLAALWTNWRSRQPSELRHLK